ncbi:hypothetical protein ACHQM5_029966 [Ranunculus cassubicifolius]
MNTMVFVWVLFLFFYQAPFYFAAESSITTDDGRQQGLQILNAKESETRYVRSEICDQKKGKSGIGGADSVRRPNNKGHSGAPTILSRNSVVLSNPLIQVCLLLPFGLFAFF